MILIKRSGVAAKSLFLLMLFGKVVLAEYECVPADEFSLANIKLRTPIEKVIESLGDPNEIFVAVSEDDGGQYELYSYHYPQFTIEGARGFVEAIYTTSEEVYFPLKLKIGDSYRVVTKKLGNELARWHDSASTYMLSACSQKYEFVDDWVILLKFDNEMHLSLIRLEAYGP